MDEQLSMDSKTIPTTEAVAQIMIMSERLAMLHYSYASTLVTELGEEKGREIIAKAIASYGQEVGERHRRRVVEAGHEPSCENYGVLPDLPLLAWTPEAMPTLRINGQERRVCPLAKCWIEKGAPELGRLYCYVDQAKFAAFDPESECRHLQNVLDGDDNCQVVAKKRSEWEKPSGISL